MIARIQLQHALEEFLMPDSFKDYCPNGLQVEGKNECRKIACAVSADLETIKQAVLLEVDALIVHHGLFWNGDAFPVVGIKKKRVELLLKNSLSLFAYHLPLDAHKEVGNNWCAAKMLGWEQCTPFEEIGVKGCIPGKNIKEFVKVLEEFYGSRATVAPGGPEKIQQVALISGGAYKAIPQAAAAGIDCMISGNYDEPAWSLAQELGIHYCALGHTATEKIGPKALAQWIQKNLGVPTEFIDTENPF